jgi:urease accessory protein
MNRDADSTLALVRLLQLASPALPIGAYSYSQGLEWAAAQGYVHDAASASVWIGDMLELVIAPGEAAILWRLLQAADRGDALIMVEWNDIFRASRETAELRAETEQMGGSLVRLIGDLGLLDGVAADAARNMAPATLPPAFALAARALGIAPIPALTAYVWSWLENQVLAAVKTIPLGQVAGQRLLVDLGARMPEALALARSITDDDVSTFAPGLALASASHETQYSRLFRS